MESPGPIIQVRVQEGTPLAPVSDAQGEPFLVQIQGRGGGQGRADFTSGVTAPSHVWLYT